MAPAVESLPPNAESAREASLTPGMGEPPEEGEMATALVFLPGEFHG